MSQPPGSLKNGLRVTEQGEMIRTKLGWTSLAVKTLALYTVAICRANLLTPPAPRDDWREMMETLATDSCAAYRAVVREEPEFVPYFRHATPEQELAKLPLGFATPPGARPVVASRACAPFPGYLPGRRTG